MRTNPLRFHPDPDNLGGGGNRSDSRNSGAAATGKPGSQRPNPHGGKTGGQAEQSNDDPDRPAGELRQDVMPDLDQPNADMPNPT